MISPSAASSQEAPNGDPEMRSLLDSIAKATASLWEDIQRQRGRHDQGAPPMEKFYIGVKHKSVDAPLGQLPEDGSAFFKEPTHTTFDGTAWSQMENPYKKARYVSEALRDLTEVPVPSNAPDLCPPVRGRSVTSRTNPCPRQARASSADGSKKAAAAGGGAASLHRKPSQVVDKLSPVQSTAGRLVRPGGLKRSVWVLPPGSGKTCMYLDVIGNFLDQTDKKWKIFLVGDADIFNSVVTELRRCPARYHGSNRNLPLLVRDMNSETAAGDAGAFKYGAWCVLNSNAQNLSPSYSSNCRGAPHRFEGTEIYWLTYLTFGNLLKKNDRRVPPFSGKVFEKYKHINPLDSDCVWILDEAHKMLNPFEDQTTDIWRPAYIRLAATLSNMDPVEDKDDPIVAAFTATPGNVICMANIMKGASQKIKIPHNKNPADWPWKVDPERFLDPEYHFVTVPKKLTVRPPWAPAGGSLEKTQGLEQALRQHGCIAPVAAKRSKSVEGDLQYFPCRGTLVTGAGVRRLEPSGGQKTAQLLELLSGLFFIVDLDTRFFPRLDRLIRPLRAPKALFWEEVRQARGTATQWKELCNFAKPRALRDYVGRRWRGQAHSAEDEKLFQRFAPKWCALRGDLRRAALGRAQLVNLEGGRADVSGRKLFGKTAVYLGAGDCPECTSTEFAVGLAFFLCSGGEGGWLNGFQPNHGDQGRLDFCNEPAVYVVADVRESQLSASKRGGGGAPKAGQVPNYLLPICSVDYRSQQIDHFKLPPCPEAESQGPSEFKVIILDVGAKKSLTLGCVNTLARMVSLNDVDEEQSKGRALRSCVFAGMPTSLWKVQLVDYVISTQDVHSDEDSFNCDYALETWNCATGQLDRDLLRLVARLGLGCRNFEVFSRNARKRYTARCPPPGGPGPTFGGEGCIYDVGGRPAQTHSSELEYWACWTDPVTGRSEIRPAVSGDLNVELVARTALACRHAQVRVSPPKDEPNADDVMHALRHPGPGARGRERDHRHSTKTEHGGHRRHR